MALWFGLCYNIPLNIGWHCHKYPNRIIMLCARISFRDTHVLGYSICAVLKYFTETNLQLFIWIISPYNLNSYLFCQWNGCKLPRYAEFVHLCNILCNLVCIFYCTIKLKLKWIHLCSQNIKSLSFIYLLYYLSN